MIAIDKIFLRKIEVEGSSVDFFTFSQEGVEYIYFDTSLTAVPEPMINAMCGLRLINDSPKKLIMLNHQKPMGLLGKINDSFTYEVEELDDENIQIVFSFVQKSDLDLNDASCGG